MNTYFLMVEKIVEDHFSESDKILLLEKLGKKKPAPQEMDKGERLREHFKQEILKSKKRKP